VKKVDDADKNIKKLVFTGTAPVDEFVNDAEDYVVHEAGGKIYDCMMN